MEQTEEIKQKIDIVDLVSSYLTLKKAGRNFKACCPFHQEKTPSFMVSPEKQIWYCFGCNQGGDIFTFIEKIEGMDFVGALNILADKAGVILDKKDFARKGEKDKYLEMLDWAGKFFSYVLNNTKVGEEAKKYLIEKRKLKEETIQEFSLGYAPDSQDSLKNFLLKKGYSESDMIKIGLVAKNSYGKIIDKFKGRIIFPIENIAGKTIGFGGRIFKESKNSNFTPPKYLNSPQSDIYDKSSVLYGLSKSKNEIREKDLVIIAEGYLDVISSYQAGVKNIVASSGTALTLEQIKILSRYTPNIAFAFDRDRAGEMAAKRAMEMTSLESINAKAILIEGGKDPDELVCKNPEKWRELSSSPVSVMEFFYNNVLNKYSSSRGMEEKKKISKELLPAIANIADPIEKGYWIKKLSADLFIEEKYIADAVNKISTPSSFTNKEDKEKQNKITFSKEMFLLGAVLLNPVKLVDLFKKIKEEDLLEEKAKNLYKNMFLWYNAKDKEEILKNFDLSDIKRKLTKDESENLDLLLFLVGEFFNSVEEKEIFSDIDKLIGMVIKNKKEKEKKAIEKEIGLVDKVKDREKVKNLLKKLQELI